MLMDSFFLLGLRMRHMEVPRQGVELELQLAAYTTATAMLDPSHICNLHHSSRQNQILNPLREARDRTHILMDTSWICYCWAKQNSQSSWILWVKNLGCIVRMTSVCAISIRDFSWTHEIIWDDSRAGARIVFVVAQQVKNMMTL